MADYGLLAQVARYVEGTITLEQLQDWVVARWQHLFALPRTSGTDLAGTIELGLAEISDGLITEEDLKATLLECLRQEATAEIVYPQEQHVVTSCSSGSLMVSPTTSLAA